METDPKKLPVEKPANADETAVDSAPTETTDTTDTTENARLEKAKDESAPSKESPAVKKSTEADAKAKPAVKVVEENEKPDLRGYSFIEKVVYFFTKTVPGFVIVAIVAVTLLIIIFKVAGPQPDPDAPEMILPHISHV